MESLKKKYAAFPEVRKISRHRHLPKVIKKMKDKEENKKKKDIKVFNEMEWVCLTCFLLLLFITLFLINKQNTNYLIVFNSIISQNY